MPRGEPVKAFAPIFEHNNSDWPCLLPLKPLRMLLVTAHSSFLICCVLVVASVLVLMSINIERSFRKEKITSLINFHRDRKKRERKRAHSSFTSSFDCTLLPFLKRFVRVQLSPSKRRGKHSTCLPDIRMRNDR